MRRPRREFTIFSLAAIDLFCSAMGAFMVISIILIPYFGRLESAPIPDTSAVETKLADQTKKTEQAREEIEQLKKELSKSSMLALFGIVTRAKSVTLVIDLSGSMYNIRNNPQARDYRPVVMSVCETIIEGMKPGQRLQVMGFHAPDGIRVDLPKWCSDPVALDARERQAAKAFVAAILKTTDGSTPTGPALRQAMTDDTEAIFLITDGAPNDGERVGEIVCREITADIKSRNAGKKEIHCIAIGEYNSQPYCVDFLMQLARENRGQFLGMPNL
jgi:hypothetical protein